MRIKNYIRILIAIVIICSCSAVLAQKHSNKGDRYFDKNLFMEAIKYYQLEAKSGNRNFSTYAKQQLAACYRILGEFELAEETYRKLLRSKRNRKDPTNFLNYGKSLKSSAKYAEAKIQFTEYIRLNPHDPMGPIFLHSCDSAQKWLEQTIGKEVENLEKVNSPLSDFSPVILASNQLAFSSSREGGKEAFISFEGGAKVNRLDLYYTNVLDLKGDKKLAYSGFKEFNSPLHEGSATFSSDGNEVYFTRTVKGKKEKKDNEVLGTLQIFYSVKDSIGHWSKPVSAFDFNSLKHSVGQPSLSKDGETLYFISDMRGGYGGTDVYYTEKREDGKWIEPINAGEEVNTFGYELFPYIADNGTLYFSSDSHIGMGKLDIFSSDLRGDKWTNIKNLKPPYNSIGNDFGIVFDGDNPRGFFSSDRFNGKGAEDIYSFSENSTQQITINGDNIEFADKSIFDGLKYVLKNETTNKDTTLKSINGVYSYQLIPEKTYTLTAKKNAFSIYNKVKININRNTSDNHLEINVKSLSQPIKLNGYLTIPEKTDTTNTIRKPLINVPVILKDSTLAIKKYNTETSGYFNFDLMLRPNNEFTILACKNNCEPMLSQIRERALKEELIVKEQKQEIDDIVESVVIQLKGTVQDKNGKIEGAKIIIYDGSKVVGNTKTDTKGKFAYPLFPPKWEYRITVESNKHKQEEITLPILDKSEEQTIYKDIFLKLLIK